MIDAKAKLRDSARKLDCSPSSDAVVATLKEWAPLHGVVAAYMPMRSEISLTALFSDPRKLVTVPRIDSDGSMSMRRYEPDFMVPHRLGFVEPHEGAPVVAPSDIEVVLVPGLAFDTKGGRLGRGRGYYDRFLSKLPGSTSFVGVTTDASLMDTVPTNEHDVHMDWIATESGIVWVGNTLSADTAEFMSRAIAAGIAPKIARFPAGTRTSADAAAAVGCELGAIAKSLVFEVEGRPVLAVCSGDRRVDEHKLAKYFGARHARPASRDMVHAVTGFPAGGTPVVGHDTVVDIVADAALGRYRRVWSAGGSLDTVYEVTLERLIAGSGARWANISTGGPS